MLAVILSVTPNLFFSQESESSNSNKANSQEKISKLKKTEKKSKEAFEIIVTATKLETPSDEVGSSFTVISKQQIQAMQKKTVLDILRVVPGLDVVQAGGPGKATSVFIRGAKSEHTLVLIDGVDLADPLSTGRAFNFAHLTTDNVERIEIIRGPQSTLYGSDAIAGVINIITEQGKGRTNGFFSGEGGSLKTLRGQGGIQGGNDRINYSLGLSHWDTEGISLAGEQYANSEKDGYKNTTFSSKIGLAPAEHFNFDLILRYINAESDIDNSGGPGGDDPNSKETSKQLFFRGQARISLFNDLWEQKLGFSLSNHDRKYRNDPDDDHPFSLDRSHYNGQIFQLSWQNNFYLHKTNTITLGLETEKEQGKSDYYSESMWGPYSSIFEKKTAQTTSYYIQDLIRLWSSWFTTIGFRIDDHSMFGTKSTYRITSAYFFPLINIKIKGSYGTGFKSPSLYQLYSVYGDKNLTPEKSTGWDIGAEKFLTGGKFSCGATYFSNDFINMIDFNSITWTYTNVAKAKTSGVEFYISTQLFDNLNIHLNYTYTKTEDPSTGKKLLRRPKNKLRFNLNYAFLEKGNINLDIGYVGKRFDTDYSTWPAMRIELKEYFLVNLAASYGITGNIQMFGRIDNLFDEKYEEAKGYGTPGISAFAGVKLTF